MRSAVVKSWRNAASLVVLAPRSVAVTDSRYNYEVLLQTRGQGASFKNSVVFPGGVNEPADASADWLTLLKSFGYTQADFDSLHRPGTAVTLIFEDDPVRRHIALRITAIRETFEELGLLVCRRGRKTERSDIWASCITDFDVKNWQNRVSKDPIELLNLCSELECYPDIWSLHYWSNWLSPAILEKRFDTAFFVTVLQSKPTVEASSEVVKAEWHTPCDVLSRSGQLVLYPPQVYELTRLSLFPDVGRLVRAAREWSCVAEHLFYHATVLATDGCVHVFPGDDLYPESVDYNQPSIIESNKTLQELRDTSHSIHRIETIDPTTHRLVLKNFKTKNVDMGELIVPFNVTFS